MRRRRKIEKNSEERRAKRNEFRFELEGEVGLSNEKEEFQTKSRRTYLIIKGSIEIFVRRKCYCIDYIYVWSMSAQRRECM